MGRHDDAGHAEALGDGAGVERPGATEGDEGEVAGIEAALHRDQADGIGHVLVHRADDGECCILRREGQGLAQPGKRRTRGGKIQRHGPAQEEGGIETAQHQIGVGDGGRLAAAAIGDGPGLGAGALRPHMQQPALVDPGDGAAARPDGAHGDAGDGDGNAEIDLELGGILLAALEDQADIRAGAADIEGEGAGRARRARRNSARR